jgi:hypothetical protein
MYFHIPYSLLSLTVICICGFVAEEIVFFMGSGSTFGRLISERFYCSDPIVNTAVFWIRFIDLNLTPIPSGVTLVTSPAVQTTLPKSAWEKAT